MSQSRVSGAVAVGRSVAREASQVRVTFLAAAVAYYAFISLLPLLLLVIAVGSLAGGEEFADFVVRQVQGSLSASGRELIENALTNASGRSGATVVGVVGLLWSGLKLLRGLDIAFSQIYRVPGRQGLLRQVLDALVVMLAMGGGVVAAVAIGGVLPFLDGVPFVDLLAALLLPLTLVLVFYPVYYFFPDTDVGVREVVPGAVLAGLGWSVLTAGFRLYAANAGQFEAYGVIGGALLLVTFLYFAAIVIILGGVLNAVLAGRTEDEEETEVEVEAPASAPDITAVARDVEAVRRRLDEKTVDRERLEADLEAYVRQRARRNHARGWGPYLVLLYGTAMTVGAFYSLSGGWAILAMLVVWLSTLGLYALMLLVGTGLTVAGIPGRVSDWLGSRRS